MAEWITLLLLAPAILLPVALLVGFAACLTLPPRPEPLPLIDSVTAKDVVTLTVAWETGGGSQSFEFQRTNPDGTVTPVNTSSASPFDDPNLDPATTYSYQVRGLDGSGEPGEWSPAVSGTTLPVVSTYAKVLTDSSPGWEHFTVVQRIEPAHLSAAGPHVRITLQASPTSDASIDRVYISQ